MADIRTYLDYILSKVYGKDVRQAIVDAINQCYADATEGITPQIDFEDITNGTRVIVTVGSISKSFDVISPNVDVSKEGAVTTVTFTDADGTHIATINDGVRPQVVTASTASAMTDTSLIYVYTGSETGYTNGDWYYYDGSDWADGGAYNATALVTDTTLSNQGEAADAKKVGDEISELKSQINENSVFDYLLTSNAIDINASDVVSGYINYLGGISANQNYRTTGYIRVKPSTKYYVGGGYKSGVGSLIIPFMCQFDSDKNLLLYSEDVVESITTEPTTEYVRITWRYANNSYTIGFSLIPSTDAYFEPHHTELTKNAPVYPLDKHQTVKESALSAGGSIIKRYEAFSIRKNNRISFSGSFSAFSTLYIGVTTLSAGINSGINYLEITNTKVIAHNSNGTSTEYEHGLTIANNIQVLLEVGFAFNCNLTLVSNGNKFTQTNIRWDQKYNTYVYMKTQAAMTNVTLSWTCTDFNKDIWMFGDSYFGYTNHWAYYLNQSGYINNCLMNSFPGEGSAEAIIAVESLLKFAIPKKIVWCMGMNDGDDVSNTVPSDNWLTPFNKLVEYCNKYGIELIVALIPSVPTINHLGQNYYVKNNGYRYIDFASAVGAGSSGTWYTGMLSNDGIHPSSEGAQCLFMQFIADFPDIMVSN